MQESKINIYIWGAGATAQTCIDCFLENVNIKGIIDNDVQKQGKKFLEKYDIYSPSVLKKINYEYLVICSIYEMDIREQIEKMKIGGWKAK